MQSRWILIVGSSPAPPFGLGCTNVPSWASCVVFQNPAAPARRLVERWSVLARFLKIVAMGRDGDAFEFRNGPRRGGDVSGDTRTPTADTTPARLGAAGIGLGACVRSLRDRRPRVPHLP